jgi:hypothetical protein
MQIFWSLTAVFSLIAMIFILTRDWTSNRTTSINEIASRRAKRAGVKSAALIALQQKLNPRIRHDKGDGSERSRE